MFEFETQELIEMRDNISEEIESKGGFESLSKESIKAFALERTKIEEELTLRN